MDRYKESGERGWEVVENGGGGGESSMVDILDGH